LKSVVHAYHRTAVTQDLVLIESIMSHSASGPLFESDHPIFNNTHSGKSNEETLYVTQIDSTLCNGLWGVQCNQVFSEEECQMIVEAAEARGFEKALLNVGGGQQVLAEGTRKNLRVMVDDLGLAAEIFFRIKDALPKTFKCHSLVGLNERLRILKYHPGDFFAIHKDGNYTRENGEISKITLLFYLNEGYEGGETTFYKPAGNQVNLKVIPKTGMILLHDHRIDHGVPELEKGVKYVIRTDVMYSEQADSKQVDSEIPNKQTEAKSPCSIM
jgi:hypothetical protein